MAKVIFLHLSDILFTGGGVYLSACWDNPPGADTRQEQTPARSRPPPGADTPQEQTPPWSRHPPRADPPRADTPLDQTPPSPPGSRLRHTVNERPVRILLEWILFFMCYHWLIYWGCKGRFPPPPHPICFHFQLWI